MKNESVSIKISRIVKVKLVKLQGKLQSRSGKKISISEVINYLVEKK